jgi:hypothetical protein
VAGERRPPTLETREDLAGFALGRELDPQRRADCGPDQRVDRVPEIVQVGDLVGDELDRIEDRGDCDHRVLGKRLRHLADAEASEDAQQGHRAVGVDARRPAGAEDGRG